MKRRLTHFLVGASAIGLMTSGCAATGAGGKSARGGGARGPAWTILCLELGGPSRALDIERFAATLRSTPGIRGDEVFVHDDAGQARLYYGNYPWPLSKKGERTPMPKALRDDLQLVRQLGDASGTHYFLRAVPVRMPTPDVGNPDWALSRAKGLYTLQVAVFEPAGDFTEYKEAAAEYCNFLREKGYEAYYHHTAAASMVTVGTFGRDAVISPPKEQAAQQYLEAGAVALPVYGPQVLALQKDELLKYNLLNGGIQYVRKPAGERVPITSRLVEVPKSSSPSTR